MGSRSVRVFKGARTLRMPRTKNASYAPKFSPALRTFLGEEDTTSRHKSVKKIWDLFKQQYPRNPTNKKEIVCDHKLKKIYGGRETLGFLEFSELLAPCFEKK